MTHAQDPLPVYYSQISYVFVAKAEAAKAEALQQIPTARL